MAKSGSRSPEKGNGGFGGSGERDRERTEKFSRSTVACKGCRMRKQKCGGEKPICLRCRTLKKPCVWPEQLKRGPSKGYNESLELRLRETESVFLSLLAIVSDEHLSSLSAFEIPEGDVTPSAADKKQKLEEWANFPLRSREDVMTWRDERLSKDARYQSPTDVKSGLEMQMDVGDNVRMDNGGVTTGGKGGAGVDREGMDKPLDNMGGVGIQGIGSLNPMDHIQATEFEHYLPPVKTGHSSISAAELPSTLPGRGMLGLSKEFQDTFLW